MTESHRPPFFRDNDSHAYLKEAVTDAVKAALSDARAIDAETHAAHHEWIKLEISEKKERIEELKDRREFRRKVLGASLVSGFGLLAGWIAHEISSFWQNHIH